MTSIIAKRRSLHKSLKDQSKLNNALNFQIGQLQALANIGVSTCMIAHEINNLLTPLANYATLAINNPDDKELTQKALRKTADNSLRATKVMDSILAMANGQNQTKENTLLKDMVDQIFSCLCRDFTKDRITVKIDIPEHLTIHVVPVEIQQVIMNLILNARDAMLSTGGTLTIIAAEKDQAVEIKISDTGCGIPPEDMEKIFNPFFTTKANSATENSGSGLGLAFCKRVMDSHAGAIKVESTQNSGTTFELNLPKSP